VKKARKATKACRVSLAKALRFRRFQKKYRYAKNRAALKFVLKVKAKAKANRYVMGKKDHLGRLAAPFRLALRRLVVTPSAVVPPKSKSKSKRKILYHPENWKLKLNFTLLRLSRLAYLWQPDWIQNMFISNRKLTFQILMEQGKKKLAVREPI